MQNNKKFFIFISLYALYTKKLITCQCITQDIDIIFSFFCRMVLMNNKSINDNLNFNHKFYSNLPIET